MEFNTNKCKVRHLCRNNIHSQYYLNESKLGESDKEHNFGALVHNRLKFSDHWNIVANSANLILGTIKRTISCRRQGVLLKLYQSLVRPKTEYCVQAWSPYLKKL